MGSISGCSCSFNYSYTDNYMDLPDFPGQMDEANYARLEKEMKTYGLI